MTRKHLYIAALALLLTPHSATADTTPLERFTRSMVNVYVAAEMCKNIETLRSENYVIVIRNYLYASFHTKVPYWVLPVVIKRINNRDRCVYVIQQGLASYQENSRLYVEEYPQSPIPPILTSEMMIDNRQYLEADSDGATRNTHYLTPTVIVK